MWRNSQSSQAKNPDVSIGPMSATADAAADHRHRPVIAIAKRHRAARRRSHAGCSGRHGLPPASPPARLPAAACRPAAARRGRRRRRCQGDPAPAVSVAGTRPARSSGTPSDSASGDAATPAAQSTVCASIRSTESRIRPLERGSSSEAARHVTPSASIVGDERARQDFHAQTFERVATRRRGGDRETRRAEAGCLR